MISNRPPGRAEGDETDCFRGIMNSPPLAAGAQRGMFSALHEFGQAYARMVVSSLPKGDLVQEGSVGLLQAAIRFDPERDISTYAASRISSAIPGLHLAKLVDRADGDDGSPEISLFQPVSVARTDCRYSRPMYGPILMSIVPFSDGRPRSSGGSTPPRICSSS